MKYINEIAKKDWCIQITEKNRDIVRKVFSKSDIHNFSFSISAFYGKTIDGGNHGNSNKGSVSYNLLSTEEFYKLIKLNQNVDSYGIY